MNLWKNSSDADLVLAIKDEPNSSPPTLVFQTVFAVAVPFFTIRDEISADELIQLWSGQLQENSYQTLISDPITLAMLKEFWGQSGENVVTAKESDIVSTLENQADSLAIVPFENITPRMKILKINGISPLDRPFDAEQYPLNVLSKLIIQNIDNVEVKAAVERISPLIPATNRDESKMTVVVMSGTTAMTRATAAKIQSHGPDYPIELVKDWFLSADLRHVSNEISFDKDCPTPDPFTGSLRFCARPKDIEVLEKLGVNVVELTGNHVNDYGTDNFASTLEMYKDREWWTYGGGMDPESANLPALIEINGNKIAFVGCNLVGPTNAWVKENYPGAAKCNFEEIYATIRDLKSKGYVVITTYQHTEVYKYMYVDLYQRDFEEAARAGADIVQGSQAHFPMGFELIDNSFIHYGLGNFLFDQMDFPVVGTRREFIDRHIIYDGKYINTEILTALLVDWSRPTPMDPADRAQFLDDLFSASKKGR